MKIKNNGIRLSVIIPAYSENQSLRYNVKRILETSRGYIEEIIIIVSPNGDPLTRQAAEELSKSEKKVKWFLQKNNPGLGLALREGFEIARGTHIQILYADCESDPDTVPVFISKVLETGADMVVASRWMSKGGVVNYPPIRYFFNRAYQQFFRTLFFTRLHDLTFGYNLIRADVVKKIIWHGRKHEIATEMPLKALRLKCRVEEIPVIWKRRDEGKSALKLTRYLCYPLMAILILFSPKKYLFRDRYAQVL